MLGTSDLRALVGFAALLLCTAAPPIVAQVSLAPPGSPPAPVLYGPAGGLTLTGANVGFQWYAGAGQTNPVRYEICVREVGQGCTSPAAAIFRPSGTLLPSPTPPQMAPPKNPRDPGFERPVRGTGTAPLSFSVALPIHFQGRRLQWSMVACVPDLRPSVSTGSPPELCSVSEARNLTWVLPLPTLLAPAHDLLLPDVTAEFSWDYGNPQNVDYFLVCLAVPGQPCPITPGVQPFALAVQVPPSVRQLPAPQSFSPFMNELLQWSVAACNAVLGCTYQPAIRRFRVPILDGSFDSIYAVTQTVKCKNCHQMHADNDTYKRHVDLGRFTREQIPPRNVNSGYAQIDGQWVAVCLTCHTSETGFADRWKGAPSNFSFDSPMTYSLCHSIRTFTPYLSSDIFAEEHLRSDALILWAVERTPDLGVQRWQEKVQRWFANGAPCRCNNPPYNYQCQKLDQRTISPHGQFVIPTPQIQFPKRIRP